MPYRGRACTRRHRGAIAVAEVVLHVDDEQHAMLEVDALFQRKWHCGSLLVEFLDEAAVFDVFDDAAVNEHPRISVARFWIVSAHELQDAGHAFKGWIGGVFKVTG
jgi:hypothetical protein